MLAPAPASPRTAITAVAVAVHVDDGGGLVDVAAAAIAIGHGGGGCGGRFVISDANGRMKIILNSHDHITITSASQCDDVTIFTSDSEGGKR